MGKEPRDGKVPLIYFGDHPDARAAGLSPKGMRLGDWRVKCVPGGDSVKADVYKSGAMLIVR